jgi:hypothetical protein
MSTDAVHLISSDPGPFVFFTELRLAVMTGVTAGTLQELRQGLATVPGSSIFYHTHQAYLAQHFQKPMYYNDFARWVTDALREHALAERIAALDLLSFTSVRQLRDAILHLVDARLASNAPAGAAPEHGQFYFCRSRSFILPSGQTAPDVPGLFAAIEHTSNASLYYHFFEARLRLERRSNNFSDWLLRKGRADLAGKIDALDPYTRTLDELKADIVAVGREES